MPEYRTCGCNISASNVLSVAVTNGQIRPIATTEATRIQNVDRCDNSQKYGTENATKPAQPAKNILRLPTRSESQPQSGIMTVATRAPTAIAVNVVTREHPSVAVA